MSKMIVEMKWRLPFTISKEGDMFLSWCPIVDVYSQGDTEQEAKDNLIDALSLFFISCFERNTLDEVLKDCGFKPSTVEGERR